MSKQIEALILAISVWVIPLYFFEANGIWIALLISLAICVAGGESNE